MSTLYPGSTDNSTTLPNPSATDDTNSPSLSSISSNEHDAIIALETKLGTGASTPSGTYALVSTGTGSSSWSLATPSGTIVGTSDTQTLTNKTIDASNNTISNLSGSDLASNTITATQIANGTITATQIANQTITATQIANATITATQIASNTITGSNIASYLADRNNNGTSVTETSAKMQTGWLAWQPGAVSVSTQSVTFAKAFTNVPIVIAVFGGDTSTTTATLGDGGANINNAYAEAIDLTTTGFSVRVVGAASWSSGNTVYIQWVATGD